MADQPTEQNLRRLRDDLGLLRDRVQNQIDIIQGIKRGKLHKRDWFSDPLYRSIRELGWSVQKQLKAIFRQRP